jgi:hypothetical protein
MVPNFTFDTFNVLHEVVSTIPSIKLNNSKCDSRIIWDVHYVCMCVHMFDNPILLGGGSWQLVNLVVEVENRT